MRAFEWNALRVGDRVLVHVKEGDAFPLAGGTVAAVDVRRGDNGVGVRLVADGPVTRPARLATHLEPFRDDADCWRCGR